MPVKIYAVILKDSKVTEDLNDYEQGGFSSGRKCIYQIFTLKQIGKKALEKTQWMYIGFTDLEKVYDKGNRVALLYVLRMYDVGGKLLNGIKTMYVIVYPL